VVRWQNAESWLVGILTRSIPRGGTGGQGARRWPGPTTGKLTNSPPKGRRGAHKARTYALAATMNSLHSLLTLPATRGRGGVSKIELDTADDIIAATLASRGGKF